MEASFAPRGAARDSLEGEIQYGDRKLFSA
jgi:hypothetical protein